MCITMERYHEPGKDYFIWDPEKNKMELDGVRVKAIYKSNLGVGAEAIICGPMKENNQLNFRIFTPDGTEKVLDKSEIGVILAYLKRENYIKEVMEYENELKSLYEEGTLPAKKIHNMGFVILANQFVEKLKAM